MYALAILQMECKSRQLKVIASVIPESELSVDNIIPDAFNPKVAEVVDSVRNATK